MTSEELLAKVHALCGELADVTEKTSHGSPAWFVAGRQFGCWADNHHGDGRLALWLAAPDGAQAMLVDADPDSYFVPPYVGPRGWIGVRLDKKLAWREVAAAIERAHAAIVSKYVGARRPSRPKTPRKPRRR